MYSIIIVDDHLIFRTGLKLLLGKIKDVKVVAEASNGKVFLEMMDKFKIDLVFMDINMPDLDGIETTLEALKKNPDLKIIGLTSYGNDEYFNKMVCAGVEGFMLKNSDLDDFKKATEAIANANPETKGIVKLSSQGRGRISASMPTPEATKA